MSCKNIKYLKFFVYAKQKDIPEYSAKYAFRDIPDESRNRDRNCRMWAWSISRPCGRARISISNPIVKCIL